jgi:hypothetical protein
LFSVHFNTYLSIIESINSGKIIELLCLSPEETSMKKLLQFIFISFVSLAASFAQPSGSFNFTTAIPMGDFKNYNSNVGFGGTMEYFFFSPSERTPYGLGINMSYVSYGVQLLVSPNSDELGVSLNKANNFASVHLLFQIASHTGTIRPYVETLFGGSYIFSVTDIGYGSYYPSALWVDDWAWSYGGGIGLKLFATGNPAYNSGSTFIDFKVRYLLSTEITYLNRNSVEYYSDGVSYSLSKSKVDMLLVSVGFFFFF